ncbi:MAG: CHASE2 domain-containing protein [Cyanobacteria bacterium P01_F01_bin.150]
MADMLVLLRIDGDWHNQGFQVVAEIGPEDDRPHTEIQGQLHAYPQLWDTLNQWQQYYRDLKFVSRIKPREISYKGSIHFVDECKQTAELLVQQFRQWLADTAFRPVENQMRSRLSPNDHIRVLIRTSSPGIHRLPWYLWDWVEEHPHAGLCISPPTFTLAKGRNKGGSPTTGQFVRILAILGDAAGIDVERDRAQLQSLPNADITFLVEPDRQVLTDQLWEQPWDILFFAGHSQTDSASKGRLFLNQTESLTLDELRYGLKRAIAHGLKLAIFNSCDGLGLVGVLEQLNLPQFIVMQEPIPDVVAHRFLTHFLDAFAQGLPLHLAKRQARERLQGLEKDIPCASWLPLLYQNAAASSVTWRSLRDSHSNPTLPNPAGEEAIGKEMESRQALSHSIMPVVTVGMVTALLILVRWLGGLQSLELGVYDWFTRLQPREPQDERLLMITIDGADIDYQRDQGMDLQGSLSPQALAGLFQQLKPFAPVSVGLDIYSPDIPAVSTTVASIPTFGICKVPTEDSSGIGPPVALDYNYVGFSDFIADGDSVLRRQLLALKNPDPTASCTAGNAFNLLLALYYLEVAAGISYDITADREFQFTSNRDQQRGQATTVWRRLTTNAGGYQGADVQGYQLLLRSRRGRSLQDIAPTIPLRDLLAGTVAPEVIQRLQGRIVLVGVTDVVGDVWLTPYSQGQIGTQRLVPGVIMQAQMVSQLLSSVLDSRSLIWWWSEWLETLWIIGWGGFGGAIGMTQRQGQRWGQQRSQQRGQQWGQQWGLGIGGVVSLWGISFIVFRYGGWIPVVPGALAFVLTLVSVCRLQHLRNRANDG